VAPHSTNGTTEEAEMITQIELWGKASKAYGGFVPQTTFRRWLTDVCLLSLKPEYDETECYWVIEWVKIARRHPKGSPIAKRQFNQLMQDANNATDKRTASQVTGQ
jgi:hypothetical protein